MSKKSQSMKKAAEVLLSELNKAKAMPVGTISKDGKRKKTAEGKWVPVGKKEPTKKDEKNL